MNTWTSESTYTIGAASRLSGIPIDTIRIWERRYRAVEPQRNTQNKRRYSNRDVVRLSLIKRLVDAGHPVSSVAALPDDALRARLGFHGELESQFIDVQAHRPTVLVYGQVLPHTLEGHQGTIENAVLAGSYDNWKTFVEAALTHKADVLVVEFLALTPETVMDILSLRNQVSPRRLVVIYAYATAASLERLGSLGVLARRAPIDLPQFLALLGNVPLNSSITSEGAIPMRKFNDESLAVLATVSTAINCECPHHVSDLLLRLNAFETYSQACENRNAEDAALHAFLHHRTAQARALVEQALEELIRIEGIELPSS